MSDVEIIKLLSQSGVSLAALVILGRIVWKVGLRMIDAIDKLVDKIDIHSKADTAAWAEVGLKVTQSSQEVAQTLLTFRRELSQELGLLRRDLVVIGTRVDTVIDTAIGYSEEPPRRRTPAPRQEEPTYLAQDARRDRAPSEPANPHPSQPYRRRDK